MKKVFFLAFAVLFSFAVSAQVKSFHDFKVKTLEGETFDMASLKGKKVMVVNVASKCGLTPQYKELQALYDEYQTAGFEIIAFPANNFLWQEPGTHAEIRTFCTENYGVTFPIMEKVSVKGKHQHEIYKWLTDKDLNGKMDSKVKWNFQKYLIDENGALVDKLSPKESPKSEKVIDWITGK